LISRPNLFTTVLVQVPGLPFPIWLPLLSLGLWGLTVLAALVLACVPERTLRRRTGERLDLTPRQLAWQVFRLANIMLWTGSFVLCDVAVPAEGVRVRIRTI